MDNVIQVSINNCLDCNFHKRFPDPDPYDSFNDDDEAVACSQTPNNKKDLESKWISDHQDFKLVTSACRPYNVRKESKIPDWCPLIITR